MRKQVHSGQKLDHDGFDFESVDKALHLFAGAIIGAGIGVLCSGDVAFGLSLIQLGIGAAWFL